MHTEFSQLRPDYRRLQAFFGDTRSKERLVEHYQLERRLAKEIMTAPKRDRERTYTEAYSQLFETVQAEDPSRQRHIRSVWRRLHRRLKNKVFLEFGCGDGAVTAALAPYSTRAYALDVTDALIDRKNLPNNLKVLIAVGTTIPLPDASVDFAFSDQVLEHLHPEDARMHLREIFRVLKPGSEYLCVTPNKVTGPHDVSCFFDYVATGLHLHEYDSAELSTLLRKAGFRKIRLYVSAYGFEARIPTWGLRLIERCLLTLPRPTRALLTRNHIARVLAGLDVLAIK